jgi:hypothetical protein
VDDVVLYLIRSDTVFPDEILQDYETYGGVQQPRTYRLVESLEDEKLLEEELNDMFYNGVSYSVVDLRRSDASH